MYSMPSMPNLSHLPLLLMNTGWLFTQAASSASCQSLCRPLSTRSNANQSGLPEQRLLCAPTSIETLAGVAPVL